MKSIKVLLVVAFLAIVGIAQAQTLPAVTLKDINGMTVQTDKLSNDCNPFIISFFSTWCKPCNRELSAFS